MKAILCLSGLLVTDVIQLITMKKNSLYKWLRDSLVVIAVFWAVNMWQTKEMLPTDGSVAVQAVELMGIDDENHVLFENSNDMPTLVYFFAPWCQVCKMSIANLNGLDTQKVNVVRIALDYRNASQVIDFAAATRSEGPILLGDSSIKNTFQVPGYPSYYLLNKHQQVVGRSMGYSTEWGMQLKTFLAKQEALNRAS